MEMKTTRDGMSYSQQLRLPNSRSVGLLLMSGGRTHRSD